MFKVFWELSDLNQIKDAVIATFFDIYEDVSSTLFYSKQHLSVLLYLSVPLADFCVETFGNGLFRCSLAGEQFAAAHRFLKVC